MLLMTSRVLISFVSVWALMATLSIESVVRVQTGEAWLEFKLGIDELNIHDRYAVAVKVSGDVVGHVPREFSKIIIKKSLTKLKQG